MAFAFKIDKALKANLYKICRLCGMDRDEKLLILQGDGGETINLDGEMELHQKIHLCLGLLISKDDKMPQNICALCLDKVNDFYEFREMCSATNIQTRKLLGLKCEAKKKPTADIKCDVDIKEEVTVKRPRKRKLEEASHKLDTKDDIKRHKLTAQQKQKQEGSGSKQEKAVRPKEEIKDEPLDTTPLSSVSSATSAKARQACTICSERFSSKAKLEHHVSMTHLPNIPRFVCTACNETIKKTSDIKNHQLWHKLSKTPYKCGLCGELIISTYSYTRHLRDHWQSVETVMLVLDRECPQCRGTFATNFLYNTHNCAVHTRKCAGCNRQLRSDAEYMRHSAICAKTYLNYSKHIPAAAVAAESCVRIKNENDVEAAAAAEALSRSSGISLDMTPVVSLTRMSTPVLLAANHSGAKRNSKKGVSKKELKRVDDLLKSTIDALVSIKHEPEVHVDTDVHTADDLDDNFEANDSGNMDHFHDGDYDGASEDAAVDEGTAVVIKQEVFDVADAIEEVSANKIPVLKIKIKKEHGTLNSSLVEEQDTRGEKKKKKKKRKDAEKHKEKLLDKITTSEDQTGTNNELATSSSAVYIKQERMDNESMSNVATAVNCDELMSSIQAEATVMTSIPRMQLQIACISSGVEFSNEMESSTIEKEPADSCNDSNKLEDIKPNRQELDRIMQITNVSSGVDAFAKAAEQEEDVECDENSTKPPLRKKSKHKLSPKKIRKGNAVTDETSSTSSSVQPEVTQTSFGKAVKSTGGVIRAMDESLSELPQIVAVSGGLDEAPFSAEFPIDNIVIKPEPCDHGYGDEGELHQACESIANEEHPDDVLNGFTIREIDEQNYIDGIDFRNLQIKQEKDIDVSEVQISSNYINASTEGNDFKPVKRRRSVQRKRIESQTTGTASESLLNKTENNSSEVDSKKYDYVDEDDDDDECSEQSEAEMEEVEEEPREYRELEMPPLLVESSDLASIESKEAELRANNAFEIVQGECDGGDKNINIVSVEQGKQYIQPTEPPSMIFSITNVRSQALEPEEAHISAEDKNSLQELSTEESLNIKIAAVSAGCNEFESDSTKNEENALCEISQSVAMEESLNIKIAAVSAGCNELESDSNKNEENALSEISQSIATEESLNIKIAAVSAGCNEFESDSTKNEENALSEISQSVATEEGLNLKIAAVSAGCNTFESDSTKNEENALSEIPQSVATEESLNIKIAAVSAGCNEFESDSNKNEEKTLSEIPQSVMMEESLNLKIAAVSAGCNTFEGDSTKNEENALSEISQSVATEESLNLKIAAVSAGCNEFESDSNKNEENALSEISQPITALCEVSSIDVAISEKAEALLNAQPFFEDKDVPNTANIVSDSTTTVQQDTNLTANDAIEEHQNILNHETQLSQHSIRSEFSAITLSQQPLETVPSLPTMTALQLHPYLEDISSSSGSAFDAAADDVPSTSKMVKKCMKANNEETENIINESADAQRREMEIGSNASANIREIVAHNPLLNPDDNINEIAENNNNANIERELQDDVAAHRYDQPNVENHDIT